MAYFSATKPDFSGLKQGNGLLQRRSQDFCIGGFQMGIVIVNVKPSASGARPLGVSGGMPPREISKFVVPRNGISLIVSINF